MTVGTDVYNSVDYNYEMMKNSGLGIASFIISLAIGAFDFVVIVLAGFVEATTPGGMDEESVIAILIGLLIIGGLAANLLGIALGVAGLVQRDCKKVFSVLGLALNTAILFGIFGLMILGAMVP